MHPALNALFTEHTTPTHASKDDIHGLARPILALGGKAQLQAAQYRLLLLDATHAPHDTHLDPKLNGMRQALGAVESAVTAFRESGERLTDAFAALDRYARDATVDIARYEAAAT